MRFLWTATVFTLDPVTAASLSGRESRALKSLSTPFITQTLSLSALSSESSTSRDANAQISVCPVRALRIYIDRSTSFRQSDQLSCMLWWLCEGSYQNRGFPLDCGCYHGCLYEPRFGMPLSH